MALKDMWIPTDFRSVFPKGVLLLGDIEAQTEFSEDRNAPKRQAVDYDREGNGSGKRLWKATIMDRAGGKASRPGHADSRTTERYLHPDRREITGAGDKLSEHLRSRSGPALRVVGE
ncbi:hypothetical protein [Nocardia sp. NPDC019304]|uniref:hypothetical protein n=1 Tax=unclassified Nocardia TaxID=2637762 RepID=UPI0033F6FA36